MENLVSSHLPTTLHRCLGRYVYTYIHTYVSKDCVIFV